MLLALVAGMTASADPPTFEGTHAPLPERVRTAMTGVSWREGCPVPLTDLSYLRVSHWDFHGHVRSGELVVHASVAAEVVEIFRELFAARFPIERMQLIEAFDGDDDRSMAANNTSAFNCRKIAGARVLSRHAFGMAIDLNPLVNPYVRGTDVRPPGGRAHLDRRPAKGLIARGDAVHRAFTSRGWTWGGTWRSVRDYQHFEKD